MQKFMEQDPLQNLSMISAKEAKYFSYRLLEHNFLQIKELRKSTSNMAPVKSFILFYVDLPEVILSVSKDFRQALLSSFSRWQEQRLHWLTKAFSTQWSEETTK